jgi:TatA/E family protein of Tat protein translocase
MSFLGVGPAELLLILIVALVVFGPERLPKIAKDLGKAMGKWKSALEEIQSVDVVAKEEEMQESAHEVVEPAADEEANHTEEVVNEEKAAEEPEVEH